MKKLDKIPSLFAYRHKRNVKIKSPYRKLCGILRFVQNVDGEEMELGNALVNGAVRKTLFSGATEKSYATHPRRHLQVTCAKCRRDNPSTNVDKIGCYSVVSKDHLPENS